MSLRSPSEVRASSLSSGEVSAQEKAPTLRRWRLGIADELSKYSVFDDWEALTGTSRAVAIPCLAFVTMFAMLVNSNPAKFVCDFSGALLPLKPTFDFASTSTKENRIQRKQLYTHWLSYSFFVMCESWSVAALLTYIPFYYAFRFCFQIWVFAPTTRGGLYVYSHIMLPFFKSHRTEKQRLMNRGLRRSTVTL